MQENLDVLISFVVVIVGLSVLVQIVVEMFKNILKVRWGVYEKFLRDVYTRYFYETADAAGPATIAEKEPAPTGTKPPSRFRAMIDTIKKREKIGSVTQRLQSLHNKVAAFAGDLKSLKDSLAMLRKNLDNHQYQFDPDSLRALLEDLDLLRLRLQGRRFTQLFEIYLQGVDQNITGKFTQMLDDLKQVVDTDTRNCIAQNVAQAIDRLFETIHSVERFVVDYRNKIADNIDNWLQDLENRYARNIAAMAFAIGAFVVVLLNADTITIYSHLRDTPTVRQNLIQHAESFATQLKSSVAVEDINALSNDADAVQKRLEPDAQPPSDAYRKFADAYQALSTSLAQDLETYREAYSQLEDARARLIQLPLKPKSPTEEPLAVTETLFAAARPLTGAEIITVKREINAAVSRLAADYIAFQYALVSGQSALLRSTDLPLGWTSERLAAAFAAPGNFFVKLVGLLITAVLVSFGAPFWNDILKALFGVRNLLRKQEPAKADTV